MSEANTTPHILIASNSWDAINTEPVAKKLVEYGYPVIVYESDKIVTGQRQFEVHVGEDGKVNACYDGQELAISGIAAAWYRRPTGIPVELEYLRERSLEIEHQALQRTLWNLVPEEAWLNSPSKIHRAEDKLGQLSVAAEVGFRIPETTITNQWKAVTNLPSVNVVVKHATQQLYRTETDTKELYTKVYSNDPLELPANTLPYPGIWQTYKNKAREWRITVVGDQVFNAAVYTAEHAKDDWRKHQDSAAVEFRAEKFPEDLQLKCRRFLNHFDLKFGAFDFIETPDGEIIFLEVNPNGQYGWLEDELGFPISDAIASELMRIAKRTEPKLHRPDLEHTVNSRLATLLL